MKTFVTSVLILHIAVGTLALLVGLIPMFSQKGNRLHNRAGLVYVWCMIIVAATALLLCGLQPFKMLRLFLSGIAVFSFYLCMTGWRATKQKKSGPGRADKTLTYAALLVSFAMVGFDLYLLTGGASMFAILFTFFGILTFVFARKDYVLFGKSTEKMHWFFQHVTRMGGSYIATFTAFLVNNVGRMAPVDSPEWVYTASWIAPSILGGMIIARTVVYYKQKFATPRTFVAPVNA